MAQQRMRSYEMHEIVGRGLQACLQEAFEICLLYTSDAADE